MLLFRLVWCYQRTFRNKNSFPKAAKAALLELVVETLHLFPNTDLAYIFPENPPFPCHAQEPQGVNAEPF